MDKRLALAIGLGLLLAGCAAPGTTPTPVEEQAAGRSPYETRCAACHDKGVNNAPPIIGRGLAPSRIETKARGGEGGHPAYGPNVLSDDQLAALVVYL